jgi:hypothetical protein
MTTKDDLDTTDPIGAQQGDGGDCSRTPYSPSFAREPLRTAYSRDEIVEKMNQWMLLAIGNPMELPERERDKWYRDNGMIHAFLYTHFPAENVTADLPATVDSASRKDVIAG